MLSISFTGASKASASQMTLTATSAPPSILTTPSKVVTGSVKDLACIASDSTTEQTGTAFSYSPAYDIYQCIGYEFVGRFTTGGGVTASYQLGTHLGVKLTFKLAVLDKWEDNSFTVKADGLTVYSSQYNYQDAERSNLCGADCYTDYIDVVTVGFNHSSPSLTLSFASTLDQDDVNEQSWGICDLELQVLQYKVYSNGENVKDIVYDTIEVFGCSSSATSIVNTEKWSFSSYSSSQTSFQCGGSTFLGSFGAADRLSSIYTIASAHQSVSMSFKLATLQSWQASSLRVAASGNAVFNQVFNREEGDGFKFGYGYGEESLCGASYPNSIANDYFAEFDHSSQSISFAIDATADAFTEQNWGICDLKIHINQCPIGKFYDGANCVAQCPMGTYPSKQRRNCLPCTAEQCPSGPVYTDLVCSSALTSSSLGSWTVEGSRVVISHGYDTNSGFSYLGTFGKGDVITKALYSLPAHNSVTIKFKIFAFNAWDNNSSILVNADGVTVSTTDLSKLDFTKDLDEEGCYKDASRDITATFSHSGQQIALEFSSTLVGGSKGEGWAICGVELIFETIPDSPPTTETPITESENPITEEGETTTTTPVDPSETPVTEEGETTTTTPTDPSETPVTEEGETTTTTPVDPSETPVTEEGETTTTTPTDPSETPVTEEGETTTTTPTDPSETPVTEEGETTTTTPTDPSETPVTEEGETTTTTPTDPTTETPVTEEGETTTTTPTDPSETPVTEEGETTTTTPTDPTTETPVTETENPSPPTESENPTTTPTDPNSPVGQSYWYWYYSFTFEWLVVIKSLSIEYITGYKTIEVTDFGNNNAYGTSVQDSMITAYTFTFTYQHSWSCVGFVVAENGISAWPVDRDVRAQSMVLCSDQTFYNIHEVTRPDWTKSSTFTISIDLIQKKFIIQQVNGCGKYTGTFQSASTLFYSIQIKDQATITFDQTIQKALPATDNFDWVYLKSHQNIEVITAAAQVQAVSDRYMNLFGQDFNLNTKCGFEFSFKQTEQWACVGFVEVASGSIDNLPLNQNIRELSHVVCSDGTQFQLSASLAAATTTAQSSSSSSSSSWSVEVDNVAHQIIFTQSNGGASYVANFDATKELHSTVQFALDGVVQFTPSIVNSAGCPQLGGDYSGEVVVSQENQVSVYHNEYYDLSWIMGLYSNQINVNSATGQVQCTGQGTHNIIGAAFTEVRVTSYTFTMAYSMSYTCMGFVEKSGLSLLDVNQDMRATSLSICSDGSINGLTKLAGSGGIQSAGYAIGVSFSVSVNVEEQSVVFRQVDGEGIYVGYYEKEENLHYSASFNNAGAIQFGSDIGHLGDNPLTTSVPTVADGVETLYGLEPAGYNFDFSWLNQAAGSSLVFDSAYAKVVNQGSTQTTSIGKTFNQALIAGFDFTLLGGTNGAPVCVGFVDAGVAGGKTISLCSDGTIKGVNVVTQGTVQVGSEYLVNIDPVAKNIIFKQIGGNGQYSTNYSSNDNLKYLVSFSGSGAVGFGPSLRYAGTGPKP